MEKFPESFTKLFCDEIIQHKQKELLCENRLIFFNKIIEAANDCEEEVILSFDKKLWFVHRKELIRELLEKFGKLRLVTSNSQHTVIKIIDKMEEIPLDVNKINIEFLGDKKK